MDSNGDLMYLLGSNQNSFGGGWSMILIVFVLFIVLGGFGGLNRFGGTPVTEAELCTSQNFSQLMNEVRTGNNAVTKGICDLGYAELQNNNTLAMQIANSFANTNSGISQLGYQMQNCCCNIERSNDANTQAILNKLCQMEQNSKDTRIAELQSQLTQAQIVTSNQVQTQNLLTNLGRFIPYAGMGYGANCGFGYTCNA